MKKLKKISVLFVIIIFIAGVICYKNPDTRGYFNNKLNKFEGKTLNKEFKSKIKSANLSTDYKIDQAISDVDKFHLNTVNVPVIVDIKNLKSDTMKVNEESEEKAIELIKKLNKKGINVILEPYPWIANGVLEETSWKPKSINTFFWNWKNDVLKKLIDDIAVPYHVDAMNVASNYVYIEYAQNYWCDTINFVRKYYKGLVTYRTPYWYTASWDKKTQENYNKKLNNKLFSKVDFISISAYFELTDRETNSVEELSNAINKTEIYYRNQNVKQEIKNFHDKWKKPIFFGELGFPRQTGASIQPWNPAPVKVLDGKKIVSKENGQEQANCFEAYRMNFEYEKWFLGFSIFAVGDKSSDKMYYPSSESTKVINKWYNYK
ncbi:MULTISPECIES: glycoside hydrolase family 113 [Clostridium]|uniref:glycoside hydrolase family 113 n=1 Tax=Clostridium TaxID=1485 RepID=UPI00069E8075|nr:MULTISPECIES: hypothetical protein [Clostridium]KOF56382.1 hydrolase [Clostridium sp. DMHC 10]MCD2347393.1 hydrolase [Clostridium guangxiense]